MQWILTVTEQPPEWFIEVVKRYVPASNGIFAAQLLWQRGIKDELKLAAFINHKTYQPASPFEFGQEMHLAMERLQQARYSRDKIAIWGDFDADGITSTAVLWDGLGQFFQQNTQLTYYIPNRLKESHGLNNSGIELLAKQGFTLIITCDTGSTNIDEITYAKQLGIDVIVTDHHTLPAERPPVTAMINPRNLPNAHQLFHLSGVAVAYKLVEALYQTLPDVPRQPLADLVDLVAIGLIADLVQLSGDCRYLAQLGIQQLQADFKQPPAARRRPGVGRLLELCQKSGDRPTDISFGLGPRINAVSRIQGDASFCVELLTSRDIQYCNQLAEMTELANSRRKSLQKDVQNAIKWQPLLNAAEIGVTTKDGVVTLTGTVNSYIKKMEAETAAKSVIGVRAVVEDIHVNFGNSSVKTDNEIATEVLSALKWSWTVPNDKVKVKVDNGWISLDGNVEWNYQRDAAKNCIVNLTGVKGVTNNLKINSVTTDEIEKTAIEKALASSWLVDDRNLQVNVHGSKVILKGAVDSLFQKDEAARLAWKAPGVNQVDNEIAIV
jgi:osmotically-inducible protein OsmY